jgi:hypothetical protein
MNNITLYTAPVVPFVRKEKNISIYTLYFEATPGSVLSLYNPIRGIDQDITVPADGRVIFYVGQTGMKMACRLSKHRTYIRKLLKGDKDKVFPVYQFCVANDIAPEDINYNLEAVLPQKSSLTERRLVRAYSVSATPLMNVELTPEAGARRSAARDLLAV